MWWAVWGVGALCGFGVGLLFAMTIVVGGFELRRRLLAAHLDDREAAEPHAWKP